MGNGVKTFVLAAVMALVAIGGSQGQARHAIEQVE